MVSAYTRDQSARSQTAVDSTLVVVDMQPECFLIARWLIQPVLDLMHEATYRGHGIVLVRFALPEVNDELAPAIWEAFQACSRRALAVKHREDGSDKVLSACGDSGLTTNLFRICGVTTDDCVTKTAHGLARLRPSSRVEVVKSACDCWQGNRFDWSKFSQLPNVVPV